MRHTKHIIFPHFPGPNPVPPCLQTFEIPHRPERQSSELHDTLWRHSHVLSLPEAGTHDAGERKKNAQRNAQPPDSLCFITGSATRAGPEKIIDFANVMAHRVHKRDRAASNIGERSAIEV
jgi:hypothetical protein